MSANSLGIKLLNPHLVSRIELVPGAGEHRLRRESIDIFVSDDNSENTYHLVPRDNWTFTRATGGVVVLEFKPALNTAFIKVHCKYDDRTEALAFDSTKATFKQAGGAFIGTMVEVYHLATERTENYTYDAVGNRQSSSYTYEGSDTEEKQTYQYYTNSDRLKTDGKYAFKYDANGNLVEKGTAFTNVGDVVTFTATNGEGVEYWKYDYDALNRLVKVTKSGLTASDQTVVEYVYDPTGLRLMKTKGTSITQYAFDLAGNQIYDTAGGQEHCYVWGFGKTLARVDGDKDSTVKYFFHTDMLGSTVLVTGDGGKIVWTGDVTPFGEKVSGEGSFEDAVRFTGKEYDEDTGLYYFNARWYDPELGRFVEEDPIRDGINWYVYCENRPLSNVDPQGTSMIDWSAVMNTLNKGWAELSKGADWLNGWLNVQAEKYYIWTQGFGYRTTAEAAEEWTKQGKYGWVNWQAELVHNVEVQLSQFDISKMSPEEQAAIAQQVWKDEIFKLQLKYSTHYRLQKREGQWVRGLYEDPGLNPERRYGAQKSDDYWANLVTSAFRSFGIGVTVGLVTAVSESRAITVTHATTSPANGASVMRGINPGVLSSEGRFGASFYVAEDENIAIAELNAHGNTATTLVHFQMNFEGQRVLNLSNPLVARMWGFSSTASTEACQAIAARAAKAGYNIIAFPSFRGNGLNFAILNNFDSILIPTGVVPIK